MLSGHGYFRSYLSNLGKVASLSCLAYGFIRDNAKHIFSRKSGHFSPDNIVKLMLQNKEIGIPSLPLWKRYYEQRNDKILWTKSTLRDTMTICPLSTKRRIVQAAQEAKTGKKTQTGRRVRVFCKLEDIRQENQKSQTEGRQMPSRRRQATLCNA